MKLVAIDLDGTLLNSQHQLVEENTEMIKRIVNSGTKLVLATGRSVVSAVEMLDKMKLDGYILSLNGTYIAHWTEHQLKTLRRSQLPKKDIKKAFTISQEERVTFIASNETGSDRVVVEEQGELVQEFLIQRQDLRCLSSDEMNRKLADDNVSYLKLAFTNRKKEKLLILKKQLEKAGLPTIFSDSNYIEHIPNGVNKGTALHFLCNTLGISLKDSLAIGDQENDIELLQMSGVGVAMGNAQAHVKAVADYVTETNDQAGVSKALLRYF